MYTIELSKEEAKDLLDLLSDFDGRLPKIYSDISWVLFPLEIEPCVYCGGKMELEKDTHMGNGDRLGYYCSCITCSATSPKAYSRRESVERHNKGVKK